MTNTASADSTALSPELEARVEELAQWLTRSPILRARSALRTIASEAMRAALASRAEDSGVKPLLNEAELTGWGLLTKAPITHTRSCACVDPSESPSDCTCGYEWRILLATYVGLANAWRKRAEEAERTEDSGAKEYRCYWCDTVISDPLTAQMHFGPAHSGKTAPECYQQLRREVVTLQGELERERAKEDSGAIRAQTAEAFVTEDNEQRENWVHVSAESTLTHIGAIGLTNIGASSYLRAILRTAWNNGRSHAITALGSKP